jgi:hypothetical protein
MPVVTAFENIERVGVTPLIQLVGGASFRVVFFDSGSNLVDTQFTFIVLDSNAESP